MGINWNRCFTCQLHELKNTTFCVWSWRNARAYNPGYNAHSTFRFDDVSHPGYGVYIIYGYSMTYVSYSMTYVSYSMTYVSYSMTYVSYSMTFVRQLQHDVTLIIHGIFLYMYMSLGCALKRLQPVWVKIPAANPLVLGQGTLLTLANFWRVLNVNMELQMKTFVSMF